MSGDNSSLADKSSLIQSFEREVILTRNRKFKNNLGFNKFAYTELRTVNFLAKFVAFYVLIFHKCINYFTDICVPLIRVSEQNYPCYSLIKQDYYYLYNKSTI